MSEKKDKTVADAKFDKETAEIVGRAWKYHDAADQLLHSRVNSYMVAQAFFLASYAVMKTADNSDDVRYMIFTGILCFAGIANSVLICVINNKLADGIGYLKKRYLTYDPVYVDYMGSIKDEKTARIVPTWIPMLMILVWVGTAMFVEGGIYLFGDSFLGLFK